MSITQSPPPWGTARPDEGTCWINLWPIDENDMFGESARLAELSRSAVGLCTLEGRRLRFSIELGDLRALDNGSTSVNVSGWSTSPSSEATDCAFSSTATLVVSAASGAALPFPELVTGDFSRTLELGLDSSADSCLLTGSLRFTVVAADYQGIADTTCRWCGC